MSNGEQSKLRADYLGSSALTVRVRCPCGRKNDFQRQAWQEHGVALCRGCGRVLSAFVNERAHLRPLVIVAIGTGMRRGDQFNLRWEQVDFQRNVIYVPNSKTGNDYPLPMNEEVRAILLRLKREAKAEQYVFLNRDTGTPYKDVKKAFGTACRKVGITNLHWHDLRHTFGTRLAEAGCSEATIAELMGHTDPKTTRRYTHGTERAKREAVEAARTRSHERSEQWENVVQIAR